MNDNNAPDQPPVQPVNAARPILPGLLALLACVAAYAVALDGPLFFDDLQNVTNNYLLMIDGGSFDSWRVAAFSSDSGALHRPLAMLTFTLNYVLGGGFSAFSLKATNLALHIGNALLVYWLLRELLGAPAVAGVSREFRGIIAITAAAVWLLHPLHVSTVMYTVQRMAQLSTLFILAGLLFYARVRMRWVAQAPPRGEVVATGLWLGLFTLLAMLSKENGVLLLPLVAVVELCLFRGRCGGDSNPLLAWAARLSLSLPVLIVVMVLVFAPEIFADRFHFREFTLWERLLTQARLLWHYLAWIVVPTPGSLGFFHDDITLSTGLFSPLSTLFALVGWAVSLGVCFVLRNRYPLPWFAALFYLVSHSLESSVLPLEMVFEHRNYLASVPVCLLLATLLAQVSSKIRGLRMGLVSTGIAVVFAVLLVGRASAWTDELSLGQYNVANHPASSRANYFYADAIFDHLQARREQGLDPDEEKALVVSAREYFARSHALDRDDFAAIVMLYQMDERNFPNLAKENDWLARLAEVAETKRLHASDIAAMGALMKFIRQRPNTVDSGRIGLVVEQLFDRYPYDSMIFAMHYEHLANHGASRDALWDVLATQLDRDPRDKSLHMYLVEKHANHDSAATVEALRRWMQLDGMHRDLAVLQRISPP